jgi:hypothetical protein
MLLVGKNLDFDICRSRLRNSLDGIYLAIRLQREPPDWIITEKESARPLHGIPRGMKSSRTLLGNCRNRVERTTILKRGSQRR